MNYKELQERCKDRNFDQIIVVTDDIFRDIANMQRIEHVTPGNLCLRTNATHPILVKGKEIAYMERAATFFYANTSVSFVEPVEGDTIYRQYLNRYGRGICCVRERISAGRWQSFREHLRGKGVAEAQVVDTAQCKAVWFDMMDTLGILFEAIRDDSVREEALNASPARICQINITTPDVRKTIQTVADLLEIGPWEVGCQSDACITDYGFRVNGELVETEFAFLLAILVCGNIEWEVIEPVKGPLVYNAFIEEHGVGFHHILQEYMVGNWQEVQKDYESNGIELNCKGKIGPIEWCYMDTSKELGFFKEMRTDAVMDQLPEGYLQFFYPEP